MTDQNQAPEMTEQQQNEKFVQDSLIALRDRFKTNDIVVAIHTRQKSPEDEPGKLFFASCTQTAQDAGLILLSSFITVSRMARPDATDQELIDAAAAGIRFLWNNIRINIAEAQSKQAAEEIVRGLIEGAPEQQE